MQPRLTRRPGTPPSPSPYRTPVEAAQLGAPLQRSTTPPAQDRSGSVTPRAWSSPRSPLDITDWLQRELEAAQAQQALRDEREEQEAHRAFAAYLSPHVQLYGPSVRVPPLRPRRPSLPRLDLPPSLAMDPREPEPGWLPALEDLPMLEVMPAPSNALYRPRVRRVLPTGLRPPSTVAARAHAAGWRVLLDLPLSMLPDHYSRVAWTPDGTTRYYCYAGLDGVAQVAVFSTVAHLQERIIALATPPAVL